MKGYWYMLEAVLAGVIIMGVMFVIVQVLDTPSYSPDITGMAHSQLQELQDIESLRTLASAGDYQTIESLVDIPGYEHSVEICDPSGSCVGSKPLEKEVWISSYIIAGDSSYEPEIVKLYLWRSE